ncbi:MAG: hypothetical protein AB7O67_07615 [Vicinamibacterales bacterium]
MADNGDIQAELRDKVEERFGEVRTAHAEAMAALLAAAAEAREGDDTDTAEALEEARKALDNGDLMGAVEQAVTLDEGGKDAATVVAEAAASYLPGTVTLAGGEGLDFKGAIAFDGAESAEDAVAASYHFLDAVFGDPGVDWQVGRCTVVVLGDAIYDVMEIAIPKEDSAVVFFRIDGDPGDADEEQAVEIGELTWEGEEGEPTLNINEDLAEEQVGMVVSHLMLHASLDLARA